MVDQTRIKTLFVYAQTIIHNMDINQNLLKLYSRNRQHNTSKHILPNNHHQRLCKNTSNQRKTID